VSDAAGVHNLELLRAGEVMPDDWYRQKYGVPRVGGAAYLRALAPAEVAAVLRFNLANQLRERGRLEPARAAYQRAAEEFPTFPEAHASLGLTLHLLGRLPQARQAYRTARTLSPTLPGLERNLAVLEAELAGAPPPR
jgi:tetratricopeptide (TPR) repeat protein